jgi:hypothetical protein
MDGFGRRRGDCADVQRTAWTAASSSSRDNTTFHRSASPISTASARVNSGPRRLQTTLGLPGTGISYICALIGDALGLKPDFGLKADLRATKESCCDVADVDYRAGDVPRSC